MCAQCSGVLMFSDFFIVAAQGCGSGGIYIHIYICVYKLGSKIHIVCVDWREVSSCFEKKKMMAAQGCGSGRSRVLFSQDGMGV